MASEAREGLKTLILSSRGRPVRSQGDHGVWESRLGRLGLVAGVDEGGLSRYRVRWVSTGSGFGELAKITLRRSRVWQISLGVIC